MSREMTEAELHALKMASESLKVIADTLLDPSPVNEARIGEMKKKCEAAIAAIDEERKPKPTVFISRVEYARDIADPDCHICHGTGIRCIPNGLDDYDREVCDCQPEVHE